MKIADTRDIPGEGLPPMPGVPAEKPEEWRESGCEEQPGPAGEVIPVGDLIPPEGLPIPEFREAELCPEETACETPEPEILPEESAPCEEAPGCCEEAPENCEEEPAEKPEETPAEPKRENWFRRLFCRKKKK